MKDESAEKEERNPGTSKKSGQSVISEIAIGTAKFSWRSPKKTKVRRRPARELWQFLARPVQGERVATC
ncbi:hypothetical protein HZH68_002235 [Vespula germanica]|uniref:Uncharacterized protein n=1 Tax=Vespula germanica TaxID=30212 RepID=A0A834L0H8_VESGE|nr:hypothetical protein HZH68_002235 [Vespula germanica]